MQARMPSPRRWPPPRWAAALAIVVVAIGVFVMLFDWNWLKGPIERRISAATGREFTIGGDLDVDLGRTALVHVSDARLANAPWSARSDMARIARADLGIALWPLLRGEVSLPVVHLERPRLLLERNADGVTNWQFSVRRRNAGHRDAVRLPRIGRLTVTDGKFDLLEPVLKTQVHVRVHSGEPQRAGLLPPLLIEGEGRYRDGEFDLRGSIDSPLQLLERDEPYRIDLRARAGATLAHARGALRSTVQLQDFDLDLMLSGDDLADLYPLAGLALPETPPYEFKGRLSRDGSVLRYRDFSGRMGDSDVTGEVSVDFGGERPVMRGALASRRLDFDDLAGVVGAAPQTGEGESASAQQRERAAARAAASTVLPDDPFNLAKLRSMDADVEFHAAVINAPKLPLESMRAHIKLDDGLLVVEPLEFGAAGGTLRGNLTLDASADPITTTTDVRVRDLDLRRVFPRIESESSGRISGEVKLAGKGNSVAKMFGTADGNVDLVMGPGRVSNLLVELAGLDVAEALRYAVGKDRMIGVRCAYTQLDVDEGVMTSQSLVFDTTDTAIVGAGKINLKKEELDLELRPQPKDRSPVALRVPLEIGGSFKDPSFRPRAGPLAARAAAAVALYAVAPPAALLALIETGPGENVKCGEALAQAATPPPDTGAEQDRPSPRG